MSINGLLVINKPSGPTSHDVVAAVRRILREKRIGHTGTLDPMATGVLPLLIGRATRLASILSGSDKEYLAGVRLGAATLTYDAAERLAAGGAPPPAPQVSLTTIEEILNGFRGEQLQTPPPFSAKKIGGVRAYRLAHAEQPVELKPVPVTVRELKTVGLADGLLTLSVAVSAGFYVRSLAHDLGQRLGCGAHLESLVRTGAAGFDLQQAISLDTLAADPEAAAARVIGMERLATHLAAVELSDEGRRRASHGNALQAKDFTPLAESPALATGGQVRLLDQHGQLVGIAILGPDGLLRPSVVLV